MKNLVRLAGEPGFEPRLTESESVVLPLNYSPTALRRARCRSTASVRRLITKRLAGANTRCEFFLSRWHCRPRREKRLAKRSAAVTIAPTKLEQACSNSEEIFARRHGYRTWKTLRTALSRHSMGRSTVLAARESQIPVAENAGVAAKTALRPRLRQKASRW